MAGTNCRAGKEGGGREEENGNKEKRAKRLNMGHGGALERDGAWAEPKLTKNPRLRLMSRLQRREVLVAIKLAVSRGRREMLTPDGGSTPIAMSAAAAAASATSSSIEGNKRAMVSGGDDQSKGEGT